MKSGIDYFPLDCVLEDSMKLIEAEFGIIGFAVVVKLWQKIYAGQGYYCEWTNEVALLFSREVGLGGNAVSEIVSASVKRGIFSSKLYEQYQILTSTGIQKRYLEAVSRRKTVAMKKSYLLLKCAQDLKNVVISDENVYIFEKNERIPEQSKVEKSKVKNSRVEGFCAPTTEDVNIYCAEENLSVDAHDFVDYYSAKGWIFGNSAMHDWKAAVRKWARNPISKSREKEKKRSSSFDIELLDKLLDQVPTIGD